MQPFFKVLDNLGSNVNKHLNSVNLSREHFSNPQNFVCEAPLYQFLSLTSREMKREDLGFYLTEQSTLADYGPFGQRLLNAKDLHHAIKLFFTHLKTHCNHLNFWIEHNEDQLWICRKAVISVDTGSWLIEQHLASFIIKLIQYYAGESWSPQEMRFEANTYKGVEKSINLANSKIMHSQSTMALPIDNHLLLLKNPNTVNTRVNRLQMAPTELPTVLEQLIHQSYFNNNWAIENIADTLNMSVRTLQRKLNRYDTNIREIFDKVRYQKACQLLKDNTLHSNQIAHELGYTLENNFIRAFKRWSGLTPKQYQTASMV